MIIIFILFIIMLLFVLNISNFKETNSFNDTFTNINDNGTNTNEKGTNGQNIVLIGDSILNNSAYVSADQSVPDLLSKKMNGYTIYNFA